MTKNMLTDLDARILRIYQSDPDVQLAELASKAGTTSAVLSRRLARLRRDGQIVAKEAIINWQLLGYKVEVSLRKTLDKTHQLAFDNFINDARKIQEIIEIQTFLGKVMFDHLQLFWSPLFDRHLDLQCVWDVYRMYVKNT